MSDPDFIVIGAGLAGCAAAAGLSRAGPGDAPPPVRMPSGLVRLQESWRDWRYLTVLQTALGGTVTPGLRVPGIEGRRGADASAIPKVDSANTNAPSMMIGHRAGRIIAEDEV